MNAVNKDCFLTTSTVCDYIPFVSTITNIVAIFFRCFVRYDQSLPRDCRSPYYIHLFEKSLSDYLLLTLVPIIGNIWFAIKNCCYRKTPEDDFVIHLRPFTDIPAEGLFKMELTQIDEAECLLKDELPLPTDIANIVLGYTEFQKAKCLARVRVDAMNLKDVGPEMQDDIDVVKEAVRRRGGGGALHYASPELQENPDMKALAFKQNTYTRTWASRHPDQFKAWENRHPEENAYFIPTEN